MYLRGSTSVELRDIVPVHTVRVDHQLPVFDVCRRHVVFVGRKQGHPRTEQVMPSGSFAGGSHDDDGSVWPDALLFVLSKHGKTRTDLLIFRVFRECTCNHDIRIPYQRCFQEFPCHSAGFSVSLDKVSREAVCNLHLVIQDHIYNEIQPHFADDFLHISSHRIIRIACIYRERPVLILIREYQGMVFDQRLNASDPGDHCFCSSGIACKNMRFYASDSDMQFCIHEDFVDPDGLPFIRYLHQIRGKGRMIEYLNLLQHLPSDLDLHLLPGHGPVAAEGDQHLDPVQWNTAGCQLVQKNGKQQGAGCGSGNIIHNDAC